MQLSFTERKSIRKNFGKLRETLSIPNLIEVQKNSYNEYLNLDGQNKNSDSPKGLEKVFSSIFSQKRIISEVLKTGSNKIYFFCSKLY